MLAYLPIFAFGQGLYSKLFVPLIQIEVVDLSPSRELLTADAEGFRRGELGEAQEIGHCGHELPPPESRLWRIGCRQVVLFSDFLSQQNL
jgi:hypothetical protein